MQFDLFGRHFDLPATSATFAVYVLVFVGVLLLFEGLRQLASRAETGSEARNRRMKLVNRGATPEEILERLFHAGRDERRLAIFDLSHSLRQAGLSVKPAVFYVVCVATGAAMLLLLRRYLPPIHAGVLAGALALLLPIAVLNHIRGKRMEKLSKQLPDALDLMARGLKVGHPLNVTLASVAREMPDPIGTEFGIVQDQVAYGSEIVEALGDLANRTQVEELRHLAVAVGIQHGTGGNLGRVLSLLAKTIRDRSSMKRRIVAISSEGRLSALILSALPFFIFGSVMATTPSYYMSVKDDPAAMPVAVIIISLVLVQALILRKLVSFKF